MKRNIISIDERGSVSVPNSKIMMRDFEIAKLFVVMIPTIRFNIRAILKSGVITTDMQHGGAFFGNTFYPDYYGLDMVLAVAFRVQSSQAEIFRKWVCKRLLSQTSQQQLIFIQLPTQQTVN